MKPGDTWKADLSKKDGSSTGTGEFTLESVDKKGGAAVAKIIGTLAIENKMPALKGKGDVEVAIAVEGGHIIAAKGKMNLTGEGPSAAQSFEVKLKP